MKTKNTKTTDAATSKIATSTDFVEYEINGDEITIPEPPAKPTRPGAVKRAKKAAEKQAKIDESCLLTQYQAFCDEIPPQTVGIDMGDRNHRIAVNDRLGQIIEERAVENTLLATSALAHQYPDARFVMEVGTHSPWVSSLLREQGCEVIVGNARKLKAISQHERKCDELDARTLAKIGRMDTSLLYPVHHVSQDAMADRLVISTRENLISDRTRSIQSIKGSVKPLSERIETGSQAHHFPAEARASLASRPDILATIEPTLAVIEALNKAIKELDKKIDQISLKKYPITQLLRTVPGVGPITALAFVLAVEDPTKILGTRNIGAYFGLVPRRDQSGDTDKQLGISKTGNKYIRKLLTQCAQYIMGNGRPDSDLRRHGMRRINKAGDTKKAAKGAKKKAITAVSRKLAVLLLTIWKSGEEYQPFYHSGGGDEQQPAAAM